jgi:hypothetical protein
VILYMYIYMEAGMLGVAGVGNGLPGGLDWTLEYIMEYQTFRPFTPR